MRLTKDTENALEILTYLAASGDMQIRECAEIAHAVDLTIPFTSKVLQRLKRSGIVNGHRGAIRGYSLARPAAKVMVRDVVEAVEGDDVFSRCIFFSEECSEQHPCPLHPVWKKLRPGIRNQLDTLPLTRVRARWMRD